MNKLAREKATTLLYQAVSNVLIEIRDRTDMYSDKPDDMAFDDYRGLGFLIKKAERVEPLHNDLWFIGMRVGKVTSHPYDVLELLKVGDTLYLRANGKTGILITFNMAGATSFNPALLLNAIKRSVIENDELLKAIDNIDKGSKLEIRKTRK